MCIWKGMKNKQALMKITTEKNKNNLHEKSIHPTTYSQKGVDSIEIKKKNMYSKIEGRTSILSTIPEEV